MESNFDTARHHLEAAFDCLSGHDEISTHSKEAIAILVNAFAVVEQHRCRSTDIVNFTDYVRAWKLGQGAQFSKR